MTFRLPALCLFLELIQSRRRLLFRRENRIVKSLDVRETRVIAEQVAQHSVDRGRYQRAELDTVQCRLLFIRIDFFDL